MKLYKVPVPTKELNMSIIETKNKVRWLENKKFKHFDNPHKTYEEIKQDNKHCIEHTNVCEDIKKIVSNSEQVAKHSFYPFIAFNIQERKVSKGDWRRCADWLPRQRKVRVENSFLPRWRQAVPSL